jgi:hypothetical protein
MKFNAAFIIILVGLLIGCGGGESESSAGSCSAFKIFNGDECSSDSLPVVQLIINDKKGCTGTIVSEDVVLTAAHCVIVQALAHPLFRRGSGLAHDIGVIRFPGIANNFGVSPARFGLSYRTQAGDVLRVIGYGFDGTAGLVNGNPRGASVTVQGFNRGLIVSSFDADGQGTCFGDSGGAATYNGRIVATVQGGGDNCAENNLNYFVDLGLADNYSFLRAVLPEVPLE